MSFNYHDSKNFISKLNWSKIQNAAQVYYSYYTSRNSDKFVSPGLPFSLAIEPTTSCNLRCPECPSGLRSFSRPTGMLDQTFFEEQIGAMKDHLINLTFYFQGEPYLHQNFLDMVAFANRNKIYTMTSTNGHYLDEERSKQTVESGLDRLIISLDGTDQETYESYRVGGRLDTVLEGARNVVRWKKLLRSQTPHIVFQYLVVKPNEHQIEEAKLLANTIGVNEIKFKTAQVYNYEDGNPLIPDNEQYSRYAMSANGKYKLKNPLHNHCWKMWHSAVITWDGKVVPCCFDKDASHEMGDLNHQSMHDIWNSQKYDQFRKSILKSRSEIEICRNCSEGLEVFSN